jgi:16S rRNA (guanine966-N2)-methyltransferase
MSDKVRGALFNSLGDITKLRVLDAFGGSGALAFEAISRGAASVVVIDSERNAQAAMATNIKKLSLQRFVRLVKANAGSWLTTTDDAFNIVLCDPPYDQPQFELLQKLAQRAVVGGLIVISLPPKADFLLSEEYDRVSYKQYGDAELHFYRRVK